MRIRTTRTWHRVNLLAVFAILAMVAGLVPGAVAAPPDGGSDYADLVFIYRGADGVPIYAEFTGSEATAMCVQPISGDDQPVFESEALTPEDLAALNGLAKPVTNEDGWEAWLIPMWGTAVQDGVVSLEDVEAAEVDLCDLFAGTVGDVVVNFAPYAHEVPFSRLSGGRAPERVLNQQYAEVTVMLTGTEVGLDPAGRLTAGAMTYELDGTAIDSSPMNQSIYRELLRNGVMDPKDKNGNLTGGAQFVLPGDPMDIAAMAMGAAADKGTPISIDTLAYMNRIYDIPGRTVLPTVSGDLGEQFLSFAGFEYEYDRQDAYPGCFSGWTYDGVEPVRTDGYIMDLVFGNDATGTVNGITGFAQRADDARLVNLFIHDAPVTVAADPQGTSDLCDVLYPPVDITPPAVSVMAPVNNSVVGTPALIEGSSTDDTGVTSVVLEIYNRDDTMWWNGTTWQVDRTMFEADLADGTTPRDWSITFDPDEPADLPYCMRVMDVDAAGNPSDRVFVNFTLTAP
jgi:hypothetical protein